MDATKFLEALDELEAAKGISKESIINALREALRKALEKSLFDGPYPDADIRVTITEDPAEIKMEYVRKVVEEVEDDFVEIGLDEANAGKKGKKYAVGDEYVVESTVEEMARLTALTVKSVLRQKLAEAEKQSLYELYKDRIGEMITGVCEKCDDKGCAVNVGRSSLFLTRRDLIGDEMIETGATVRLYVANVSGAEAGKAPMVKVSRSDPGFLRRIFEEEVREIYDGTVIIKNLAREAGIRSKLAVYSNDPNVDSVGCCIGQNGNAIQKIVAQLGNSRDKEKIDVIQYSPNDALFIIDALRPAQVLKIGLYTDEQGRKCAVAVVPNGQLSLAIGKKGANVRVASKLTECHIDIKEESMADEVTIELKSVEAIQEEEKLRVQREKYEKYLSQVKQERAAVVKTEAGVEKAKPQKITDEEIAETSVTPEVKVETPAVEEVKAPEVAPVVEETPVVKPTVVKTTTSIDALEAALESDKKKETFKATQKTSKRPRKIDEDEVAHEEVKTDEVKPQMAIYTAEELAEMEKEDEFNEEDYIDSDEDIDYDEFDDYYDDDDK